MFEYLLNNIFGRSANTHPGMVKSLSDNPKMWIDKTDPNYQPSIFAAPQYEMMLGQSGAWKGPFLKIMSLFSKNPSSVQSVNSIVKKTGLSKYQAETLKELLEINRFAVRGE